MGEKLVAEISPNFVNPSYATPEQIATQRAYAAELQKQSGQQVNRPLGAIANALNAWTSNLVRSDADKMQTDAATRNSADVSALIAQLQKGQPIDPATAGRVYANPMAAPEHRALIGALVKPEAIKSEYGQPAYASPSGGVQPAPIAGQPGSFNPGYRVEQGAEGVHSNAPFPAPNAVPPTPPGVTRLDPAATNAWRQSNPLPPGVAPGGPPQAGAVPPAAPPAAVAPNGAPNVPMSLDQLAAKGREFAAAKTLTQGGAEAEGGVIKQDVENAALAPETLKGLGIIKDNIAKFGDKITFGPTSQFTNEFKRLAANYAPGPMKDQLSALAAADSIEKVNLGLAGALAKQVGSGTQGELFKAMGSVPGMEKSKEGAVALIDMLQQSASKQQALGKLYADNRGNLAAYQAARQKYLTDHPVVNPLTGNPIEMDIEAARKSAPAANTATGPAQGTIFNGYRFKGGNPKDKSNWEPVT